MGSVLVDNVSTNLTGYSVQEDATPLDPSDTTGGVGQIDFTTDYIDGPEGSIQLQGLDVEVRDQFRGRTYGNITEVKFEDGLVDVSADSRLGAIVGVASARPIVDTLQNVVMYYLSLGNITSGVIIDDSVGFIPVAAPGFNDDVWLRLKQLVSTVGCEISLVNNNIVVRRTRTVTLDDTNVDISWTVSSGDTAQSVEVEYYGNEWIDNALIYPFTKDERDNMQSWQVEDGAVLEDDISLSVSLASVNQPVAVEGVPKNLGIEDDKDGTVQVTPVASMYSVYDADNVLITGQTWRALGGKVELKVNPDTVSLHIKITGAKGAGKTPYRLVDRTGTADDAEDYPSLFITGTGVGTVPTTLTLPTGLSNTATVTQVGTTAQVPVISTLAQAYDVGVRVAAAWTGSKLNLSGTASYVNIVTKTGSAQRRSFKAFNQEWYGQTFAAFNADYAGKTFAQFNAEEYAKVDQQFDNQTYGNVAGARFKHGAAYYRIDSSTITDETIEFAASADTTFADFNTAFTGATIADFNLRFAGKQFKHFSRIPLTQALSTGTIYVPPVITNPVQPPVVTPTDPTNPTNPTDPTVPPEVVTPVTNSTPYPDTFYPDLLYPVDIGTVRFVYNTATNVFTFSNTGVSPIGTANSDGTLQFTDATYVVTPSDVRGTLSVAAYSVDAYTTSQPFIYRTNSGTVEYTNTNAGTETDGVITPNNDSTYTESNGVITANTDTA